MKPTIEWVRNSVKHPGASAGWELRMLGQYMGVVFSDGSGFAFAGSDLFRYIDFGSQPLAAQALLRAAGVEP